VTCGPCTYRFEEANIDNKIRGNIVEHFRAVASPLHVAAISCRQPHESPSTTFFMLVGDKGKPTNDSPMKYNDRPVQPVMEGS